MCLPILASSDDLNAIVSYLKTKPTGATIQEAKSAIDKKILDNRKLNAYEAWDFISKEGKTIKLTPKGWDFSRKKDSNQKEYYAKTIRETKPYNLIIEWAFHQGLEQVTNIDVAAHWHEHCKKEIGTDNERSILLQVVCFFKLAQAAGLGNYTEGRRGQPSRFSFDENSLSLFIDNDSADMTKLQHNIHDINNLEKQNNGNLQPNSLTMPMSVLQKAKIFISHSKNIKIVKHLKESLDIADFDYEVAVEEETSAIPVPEKVLTSMRRCTAAIICVTADEQKNDSFHVNENVLIEIGAAFVLYDKKVILVWDRRIPVPTNLQGLYRCEFEGNELSWNEGNKLMKAVKKFRDNS